ncbi:Protein dachsous, partial [Toxocara canis]
MSRVLLVLLVSLLLLFTRTNGSELQREFRVSESVPIGHIIGYISGSALIGLKPTYYIVYPDSTGQVENYIGVDDISGEIIVKSGLDYERRTSYDFVAIPVDGSQAIHVYVRVLDENDNAPTFPVPFVNIEISEYARLHSELALPSASDADAPPLSVDKYRILSGNVNNAFRFAVR